MFVIGNRGNYFDKTNSTGNIRLFTMMLGSYCRNECFIKNYLLSMKCRNRIEPRKRRSNCILYHVQHELYAAHMRSGDEQK